MTANVGEWRSANGMSYRDAMARIQNNRAGGTGGASGDYDQGAYLSELNQRVDANVIAGAWNGKSAFGSNQGYTVMIHPDFLKMMHGDPELGAYYEEQINILAEEGERFKKQEEAKGNIIHSQGTYIDENGGMSSYCSFTMTSEGGGGNVKTGNKPKSAKELIEEMREKIEEDKKEEKLEEKREDKRALLDSLNAAATVTVARPADNNAAESAGGARE